MPDASNDARIQRMLAEGKLTEDEAERLRAALGGRPAPATPFRDAREVSASRRQLWLLLGFLAAAFLLGGATQWLLTSSVTPTAPPAPAASVAPHAPAGADRRPIDLSRLAQERRTTMNRALPVSLAIVAVVVLAVLGVVLAVLYNGLVTSREQVNAGWSQVENVYQRRLDLVPLLVDAVQTYTEHERDTLEALTRARADAIEVTRALGDVPASAQQLQALEASQGKVQAALGRLLAVVENYPELKASQNFLALQDQIEGTENRVAIERRNFNEFSRRYNTRLQTFPGNIVAQLMGFTPKPYFEAEPKALDGVRDVFRKQEG